MPLGILRLNAQHGVQGICNPFFLIISSFEKQKSRHAARHG